MAKVALIKCDSYEYDLVLEAVKRGIQLIGGAEAFIKSGEKILLKPNLLSADLPEKCSTTHHTVFKAVGEILLAAGAKLSYGDSPGIHSTEVAAKKTLIAKAAEEIGVPLSDFKNGSEVVYEKGMQNKRFTIAKGVLESDGVVSLPKLKTHGLARMTGCIKNQFGCIPGALKGEFHVRLPDANDFCRMLVDLNGLINPRLYIMDGIYAMEGNGPRGGTPKKMGVLLFSSDPVALDSTVCRLVNLNPDFVPTIKFAVEAGLGTLAPEEIELLGDKIENFYYPDFNVKREPIKAFKQGGALQFLRNSIVPKPYIISNKCVKCGMCIKACPVKPKVVDWFDGNKNKVPSYEYKRCIRCYCCQELCPESAIELKVPLVRRLFSKNKSH